MGHYLVTGGCGFIGSHLVDSLLGDGHAVVVVDDLSSGHRRNLDSRARLLVGDVADRALMAQAIAGADGCFHLAAIASVARSNEDWLGTHRTNLTGAITVFDAARGAVPVPVVYASSAAVYGAADEPYLTEDTPTRPLTAYGADKLGCELHARVASHVHGIATTGLRLFNVYGPRQDPHSPYSGVISIFAERIAAGRPVTIHGDGRQTRDFVYVADVVAHLRAAMDCNRAGAAIYNVCTRQATSVLELARLLAQSLGVAAEVLHGPARPGDMRRAIGSPDRAIDALGVRANILIEAGFDRLLAAGRRPRAGGQTV
ncbi:MAG: NAD-dependent epimerase/dehydratase family protein [Aliidongia sp.]